MTDLRKLLSEALGWLIASKCDLDDAGDIKSVARISLLIDNIKDAFSKDAALAEPVEPIGYIDAEQLRRWNVLKGTEYESPERCYMPFSRKPWKSEMSDCSLAVYAAPASQWRRVEDEKPNEGEIVWIGGYGNRGPFYAEAKYENGEWLMFDQETDQYCWPCEYPDYWSPITPLPALPEDDK